MKVIYTKNEVTVIVTHDSLTSCDYVILGDDSLVSEAELFQMADMLTPEGWAAE